MNRSVPITVLTMAAVAPPVAAPWLALAGVSTVASAAAATTTSRLVYGPSVDMRWGPVRVRIRVRGKKMIGISATSPTERPRSAFINRQAIPILRQEALKAQSAHIFLVSGATLTSEAFVRSLQSAVSKAHV
jgi:uncharacterized protein with FMN-binding domain